MSEKRLEKRSVALGEYIYKNKVTIRDTAKYFKISKSTVHKDVSERLMYFNRNLYKKVKKVLAINKSERHIRGGLATKKKYINLQKVYNRICQNKI